MLRHELDHSAFSMTNIALYEAIYNDVSFVGAETELGLGTISVALIYKLGTTLVYTTVSVGQIET
jgi:hypothetical protein